MTSRMLRLALLFALCGLGLLSIAGWMSLPATYAANVSVQQTLREPSAVLFTVTLQQVASTLVEPVDLQDAQDGSRRLFVVEQPGRIRVIENGVLQATPYITLTSIVHDNGNEQGLLGLAFDPDFASNGTFYLSYNNEPGADSVIARYVVSNPAANVANVINMTHLITVDQPQSNHNGGQLQFGPNDDYLYISLGDGGGAGDDDSGHAPGGNGQSLGTHLGKLLRVNVRGVPTYTIPASNPFTQSAGVPPEIWAYGLRNPWRFSFDSANGDMYIADVGQYTYEEVSYEPAPSSGGVNYGWRCKEGFHNFNFSGNCASATLIDPVVEFAHVVSGEDNCSVTGGYVYHGQDYPWMDGIYFYADYCSGRIWALEQTSPGVWSSVEKLNVSFQISSFGEDEDGEMYVLDHSSGRVYKLTSSIAADISGSYKTVSNLAPLSGDVITYSIVLHNVGDPFPNIVRLTDTIPSGLDYVVGSLNASQGSADDASAPTLIWSGNMSDTSVVTVTYAVMVTTVNTETITNTVTIDPGIAAIFERATQIIANGARIYLPIVYRNG